MAHDRDVTGEEGQTAPKSAQFLGSLKDALAAAARDETAGGSATKPSADESALVTPVVLPPPLKGAGGDTDGQNLASVREHEPVTKSAAEAAREARESTGDPTDMKNGREKTSGGPTTRAVKPDKGPYSVGEPSGTARTQLVRGKKPVERGIFNSDPVVGWLVIVGGPGIGAYRPIFEGNNAIGRGSEQRIPLDFGDDSISSQEQAYIRYDSGDRSFLFVPNLAKTNVVSVNNKRPTGAVELTQMDVITMGRTQLVFVPFCGSEFDWAELVDAKD